MEAPMGIVAGLLCLDLAKIGEIVLSRVELDRDCQQWPT